MKGKLREIYEGF